MSLIKKKEHLLTKILKPAFWVKLSQIKKEETKKFFKKDFWELIAEEYDSLEESPFYSSMQEDIIQEMEKRGALKKDYSFFDVACGTGTYTVKIAQRVEEVFALDISPSMLYHLRKKLETKNIKNVQVIEADWKKYEPGRKFDTVFVSMTPILRDLKEVKRLFDCAEKFFVAVQWAGLRKNLLHEEIEKNFFKKKISDLQAGFFILFNYFYTIGHPGDAKFYEGYFEKKNTIEKFWQKLKYRFESKGYKISAKKEKEILKFLEKRATDGLIETKTKVRIGALFIQKEN
ncbi:MAG: class I SAM-dependent methyltransferase [Caldimicrobium sp.]